MYICVCAQTHFHGSSRESLHKHFDVDILPEELGGTLPSGDQLAKVWSQPRPLCGARCGVTGRLSVCFSTPMPVCGMIKTPKIVDKSLTASSLWNAAAFINSVGSIQLIHSCSDILEFSHVNKTRGHAYKLFKSHCNNNTRYRFFAERVVSVWNSFPASMNFSTLGSCKHSITDVDFTNVLKYA